jgi:hypothetical protein
MIGNSIGLLPWVALYALAGAQILNLLAAPSMSALAWAVLGLLCIVGATIAAARGASLLLGRNQPSNPEADS